MAAFERSNRPGRAMLIGIVLWHLFLLVFARIETSGPASTVLAAMGIASSISIISMSVLLMNTVERDFRGRVMGVRMLAVYGLPMGLLLGGALAEVFDIQVTITVFRGVGLLMTVLATAVWPPLWGRNPSSREVTDARMQRGRMALTSINRLA